MRSVVSSAAVSMRSFDPASRLERLDLSAVEGKWASQRITYDGWERVASANTDFATGTDAADSFAYDGAGRIGSWTRTGFGSGHIHYTFDKAGNLWQLLSKLDRNVLPASSLEMS